MGRDVKIGDRTVTISRFKLFKALEAGKVISEITEQVPTVGEEIAKFSREYEKNNYVQIDRATATFRYPEEVAHMSDEVWKASNNMLTLRESPSVQEQVLHVFPEVFQAAQAHVLKLLALLVTPDSELREAHRADNVDIKLEETATTLMHEADLADLVDLAEAAVDTIKEQFSGKEEKIKELRQKLRRVWSTEETTTTPVEGNGKPDSSTDSVLATTGPTSTRSLKSPGPPQSDSPD